MIRPRTKHAANDLKGVVVGPSELPPIEFNQHLFKNAATQASWLTEFKEWNNITGQNIDNEFPKSIENK